MLILDVHQLSYIAAGLWGPQREERKKERVWYMGKVATLKGVPKL